MRLDTSIHPAILDVKPWNPMSVADYTLHFSLRSYGQVVRPLLVAAQVLSHVAAALQYHLHTAILFTWTDYKTIMFPVVSTPPHLANIPVLKLLTEHVRCGNGTSKVRISSFLGCGVDMDASTSLQRIKPSKE